VDETWETYELPSKFSTSQYSSCYFRFWLFFGGLSSVLCHYRFLGGAYRFTVFRAHLWQQCFCDTTVVFNCKTYGNKHKHIKWQQFTHQIFAIGGYHKQQFTYVKKSKRCTSEGWTVMNSNPKPPLRQPLFWNLNLTHCLNPSPKQLKQLKRVGGTSVFTCMVLR